MHNRASVKALISLSAGRARPLMELTADNGVGPKAHRHGTPTRKRATHTHVAPETKSRATVRRAARNLRLPQRRRMRPSVGAAESSNTGGVDLHLLCNVRDIIIGTANALASARWPRPCRTQGAFLPYGNWRKLAGANACGLRPLHARKTVVHTTRVNRPAEGCNKPAWSRRRPLSMCEWPARL